MPKNNSEIRKSYIFDKYAVIAPNRAKRPHDIDKRIDTKNECVFCLENLKKRKILKTIKAAKNNSVIAIKNEFPAVTENNAKAYGKQEVIIESLKHNQQMADMPVTQIIGILKMYAARSQAIAKDKKIKYILCLKNQGKAAGASLVHPHSQIFATAIIPPELQEESEKIKEYFKTNKRCAYCDIIKKEAKSSRRVYADKNMLAFAPYASQFPYEIWIFSQRHTDNITRLKPAELKSLAVMLKKACQKLKKINLPFNYFLHNSINDKHQHFYVKIQPRRDVWAGVELGSGLTIDSVAPEKAAKYYRQK